jgi:DNA-binding response OmpR family regulator
MRVLVAEDDAGLRSVLERGLREHGYEVAILDWRMPAVSGLDVVSELRRTGSPVPVLMLTARDAAADRVRGLDEGADDYLVKPFAFEELLARIRALQRRSPALQSPRLVLGDLEFNPATREVFVDGRNPGLTGTELSILEILLRRTPSVVERRAVALHVWAEEADALGSNTIDVHMARLRGKLGSGRIRIETVRGIGFRIVPT